jgi:hypothetical protein
MSWRTLHLLLTTILYPISLKMDTNTITGTIYSVVSISIAIGLLFMSRPAGPPITSPISSEDAMSGLGSAAKFFGVVVPYLLIIVGPLIDLYNQKLKYSLVSIVGILSMGLGFVIQRAVHGSVGQLTMLTVATSAMVGFLVQDLIIEPIDINTKWLSSVFMILALGLQVLNSARGSLYSSALMNDLAAVSLGSGLGVIGWLIVWSIDKTYLPYYVLTEKK